MIRVIIVGAAGRMGRHLVTAVLESGDMKLAGALEHQACPLVGKDAGTVAGHEPCGIEIVSDIGGLGDADAAIDFSTGPVADNAEYLAGRGCSIVIGTTALKDADRKRLESLAAKGARIVQSSNMSVGVNLLLGLCAQTAKILGDDYDVEIVEMHHRKKKDSPSGTALSLAESVASAKQVRLKDKAVHGRSGITGERPLGEIGIHAVRGGDVVGDHTVIFAAEGERLELVHKASSRNTFAKGAVRAVRFLQGARPGLYSMKDVLGLN